MKLPPEEPAYAPWRSVPVAELITALLRRSPYGRPLIVGIDGRSGSGKTTTAAAMHAGATGGERAVLVHTNDVAWRQARFDWDYLLIEHVLNPVRAGKAVCWRPPAWIEYARDGLIELPADISMLLIEGVGSIRRQLAPLLDARIWVQSDTDLAFARGIARDCALHNRTRAQSEAAWEDWLSEEVPHLAEDRPWERADLVVAGTEVNIDPEPEHLIVAAHSPLPTPR